MCYASIHGNALKLPKWQEVDFQVFPRIFTRLRSIKARMALFRRPEHRRSVSYRATLVRIQSKASLQPYPELLSSKLVA